MQSCEESSMCCGSPPTAEVHCNLPFSDRLWASSQDMFGHITSAPNVNERVQDEGSVGQPSSKCPVTKHVLVGAHSLFK